MGERNPDWPALAAVVQAASAGLPAGRGPAEFGGFDRAVDTLAALVAEAFDLPPFRPDGTGLTQYELIHALADCKRVWAGMMTAGR